MKHVLIWVIIVISLVVDIASISAQTSQDQTDEGLNVDCELPDEKNSAGSFEAVMQIASQRACRSEDVMIRLRQETFYSHCRDLELFVEEIDPLRGDGFWSSRWKHVCGPNGGDIEGLHPSLEDYDCLINEAEDIACVEDLLDHANTNFWNYFWYGGGRREVNYVQVNFVTSIINRFYDRHRLFKTVEFLWFEEERPRLEEQKRLEEERLRQGAEAEKQEQFRVDDRGQEPNACDVGGTLFGKCQTAQDWETGWYLHQYEQGLITREDVPQWASHALPPIVVVSESSSSGSTTSSTTSGGGGLAAGCFTNFATSVQWPGGTISNSVNEYSTGDCTGTPSPSQYTWVAVASFAEAQTACSGNSISNGSPLPKVSAGSYTLYSCE